jgi:hypothetical protein
MSNIAGKAYAMNVLTPMRPAWTGLQHMIFWISRAAPTQLAGLLGLKFIHFARWVVIQREQWPVVSAEQRAVLKGSPPLENNYMLFLSNFNGTWDQYIDAFADGIPSGLDFLWYTSTKYPHSIPIAAFKDYISHNQIQTNYFYNATPGAAQRDVKHALVLRDALQELVTAHAANDPAAFAVTYARTLASMQSAFGAHGIAPSASPATERAEAARRRYFDPSTWGTVVPPVSISN